MYQGMDFFTPLNSLLLGILAFIIVVGWLGLRSREL